jgi:uncharacterized protein YndB with AHSA1/START domain
MTAPHDDPSYSFDLEIDVPGTPEQVWEAIATGPGITAWFVPAEVTPGAGGRIAMNMDAGVATGVITGWEPPRRLVYEEVWEPEDARSASKLATEFLVEARGGDSCVVRLVTNVFGSTADWGDELASMREGWTLFLRNLARYLEQFPGRPCGTAMATGKVDGSLHDAWATSAAALGIDAHPEPGAAVVVAADGLTPVRGTARSFFDGEHHQGVVIDVESPAQGTLHLFDYAWRGDVFLNAHAYLYGDGAAEAAGRLQAEWSTWMPAHFPMPDAEGTKVAS